MKRDEPFEGKCTYESDSDHVLVGRITFVLHTDHLECLLIIFSLPNQSCTKLNSAVLMKSYPKMQGREECVIGRQCPVYSLKYHKSVQSAGIGKYLIKNHHHQTP